MRDQYIPIRKMRSNSAFGMNGPSDGKRFGRMIDAFQHSAVYWGEHGDWLIIAAQTGQSGSIDRSNFQVLLKDLGGESDTVRVEQAKHWAVGFVDYLIIDPTNHKALRRAIYAHSAVYDYPILDESHFSDLEYNEAYEFAEGELKDFGDHWEDFWREETSYYGFSEDELWVPIERARERLEAFALIIGTSCPLDPRQMLIQELLPKG